jgi:hypothetical protein
LVLEQGRTRMADTAAQIIADPRAAQLLLGGTPAAAGRAS